MVLKNCILILVVIIACFCNKRKPDTFLSFEGFPCKKEFSYNYKKLSFRVSMDSVAELKYKKLDSICFFKLLKGTDLESYYSKDNFRNFLYNFQDSTNLVNAVTLILSVDYNYYLKYLTFDLHNHLIDSLDIAGFGGDGGFGFEAFGRFL